MKEFKGDIKQIKVKLIQLFGERIRGEYIDRSRSNGNLQKWEKTMLKTFSRHKDVFSKVTAFYSLHNTFNYTEQSRANIDNNSISLNV